MGLRDFARRFGADLDTLHAERLQERYRSADLHAMGTAPLRVPVRVAGEIQRHRMVPRHGSPLLEVSVSDGTGTVVAQFTGRRSLGGMEHGRGVMFEGVIREQGGRRVLLNPAYTLLPRPE